MAGPGWRLSSVRTNTPSPARLCHRLAFPSRHILRCNKLWNAFSPTIAIIIPSTRKVVVAVGTGVTQSFATSPGKDGFNLTTLELWPTSPIRSRPTVAGKESTSQFRRRREDLNRSKLDRHTLSVHTLGKGHSNPFHFRVL